MLSRVAENLFWIGRYMERAENIARLVDAARRMAVLPRDTGRPLSNEWSSILIAAGSWSIYPGDVGKATAASAVDHLVFDASNPSSVYTCIKTARENARAIRTALTQECWEALNAAWTDMRMASQNRATGAALVDLIDWIKAQSALFRGAFSGTAVRDDSFEFVILGMALERVDSTARLLDVKYHVLLPSADDVGSGVDHYQWQSLLQAAAAQRAYIFLTQSDVSARGVAQFLLLAERFPRSVRFNVGRIADAVTALDRYYGQPGDSHELATRYAATLDTSTIDEVFAYGLHEFLTDVIERNYALADSVARTYGFAPILNEDGGSSASGEQ